MLFDNPIFKNWYTDLMDVCRVVPVKDGNVTRQERKTVAEKVPCRVYHTGTGSPGITDNAARIRGEDKLSCDLSVDIQAGDELYFPSKTPARFFSGKLIFIVPLS